MGLLLISFIVFVALLPVALILTRWVMIQMDFFWKPLVNFCCKIGWHWETEITGYTEHMDAKCLGCNQKGYIDCNNNFKPYK